MEQINLSDAEKALRSLRELSFKTDDINIVEIIDIAKSYKLPEKSFFGFVKEIIVINETIQIFIKGFPDEFVTGEMRKIEVIGEEKLVITAVVEWKKDGTDTVTYSIELSTDKEVIEKLNEFLQTIELPKN